MKPAVFLDRDGTVIEDLEYPREPERVRLFPGAAAALRRLDDKGYLLFLVSNQSGVGRGLIAMDAFHAVHRRVEELLREERVPLAGAFYCLHAPEARCACRKPAAGLVPKEHAGAALDWRRSFVIGDKASDVGLARAIGAGAFLVLTGKGARTREHEREALGDARIVSDLAEAAEAIPEGDR